MLETFYFQEWPIKYEHIGKGEPVILLHNGGTSHLIWSEIMPHLSDEYEMFAFDLLGYGASAKPGAGYNLKNYIDFLVEFANHYGLAPVNMVGNCMGSAMSLGFSQRHPQKVRALVLINPLTEATFLAGFLGPLLRIRKGAPLLAGRIYNLLRRIRINRWVGSQAVNFQIGPHGRSLKIHKKSELCDCFTSTGQMDSLLGVFDDLVNFAFLDQFEPDRDFPPVCTIWGLQNRVLSSKAGRKLNTKLRPMREEWLQGCGHLPMLEKPEQVAFIIREFLSNSRHHEKQSASENEEVQS